MKRSPRGSSTPFSTVEGTGPDRVLEFASQAVEYVRRALGVTMEYDSETLPILDHYLRQVTTGPKNGSGPQARATELVAATAGAYFGEVVRRRLGGSWNLTAGDPGTWRLVLPSGLWFWPTAVAMAAILGPDGDTSKRAAIDPDDPDDDPDMDDLPVDDLDDGPSGAPWDASLQAPPLLRSHVARVLSSMADVSEDEYYSLCCRLDTLEHVQAVLAAMASARRDRSGGPGALD
ncbi:MAG TPA: hypothetical protein VNO33_12410 [Kofleriaceae bacterium]|nr:hypothetical protein [Kofleriaceae bacterium]